MAEKFNMTPDISLHLQEKKIQCETIHKKTKNRQPRKQIAIN